MEGYALGVRNFLLSRGQRLDLVGFESMGVIHRIGATVLFIVFFLHLRDLRQRKRKSGKTWLQLLRGPESISRSATPSLTP